MNRIYVPGRERPISTSGVTTPGSQGDQYVDRQLGYDIENNAINTLNQRNIDRAGGLSDMAARNGVANKADYSRLADSMFGMAGRINQGQAAASREMGGDLMMDSDGTPLGDRLSGVVNRQISSMADEAGRASAVSDEAAASRRLAERIGYNVDDRNSEFQGQRSLNQGQAANDSYEAQGQLALSQMLNQAYMGQRSAEAVRDQANAERQNIVARVRMQEQLAARQAQIQARLLEEQRQYDQMIMGVYGDILGGFY